LWPEDESSFSKISQKSVSAFCEMRPGQTESNRPVLHDTIHYESHFGVSIQILNTFDTMWRISMAKCNISKPARVKIETVKALIATSSYHIFNSKTARTTFGGPLHQTSLLRCNEVLREDLGQDDQRFNCVPAHDGRCLRVDEDMFGRRIGIRLGFFVSSSVRSPQRLVHLCTNITMLSA